MANKHNGNWLDHLARLSLIKLLVNPVTMMLVVTIVAIVLWNRYHERLQVPANRTITRNMLHLNESPAWIKSDISEAAIRDSRLDEVQLDRPDAIERVAASLAVQPWVKAVHRITKSASGIHAELQYRRPVAIVEIGEDHLVPVDDEAVVLDGQEFSEKEVSRYWRVSMPRPLTNGLATGRLWDDLRVSDAVLIATAWQDIPDKLGLFRIVNRSYPTRDRLRLRDYELWTRSGTIVVWGNPPGYEIAGEASAPQKIEAIRKFIQTQGPLEAITTRYLDVRQGVVTTSTSAAAREPVDFIR